MNGPRGVPAHAALAVAGCKGAAEPNAQVVRGAGAGPIPGDLLPRGGTAGEDSQAWQHQRRCPGSVVPENDPRAACAPHTAAGRIAQTSGADQPTPNHAAGTTAQASGAHGSTKGHGNQGTTHNRKAGCTRFVGKRCPLDSFKLSVLTYQYTNAQRCCTHHATGHRPPRHRADLPPDR